MSDKKIRSLKDLETLSQKLALEKQNYKARILVCMTGCRALGAQAISEAFKQKLESLSINDVAVVETGCIGMCAKALTQNGEVAAEIKSIYFYNKQNRQVLRNCGRIDPKMIKDAFERGTYLTAVKALTEQNPQQIIDEMIESEL